ncbi:MAG: hypothetical protein D6702_09230 [Planctomycetota bacterium]|nr:MAG: hypothetical protein D6702_09230 [Planctomycetota bacterium]
MTWRRFLLFAAVAAALAGLALLRGLRYPPLQLDPDTVETELRSPEGWTLYARGAYRRQAVPPVVFRAWSPEPRLLLEAERAGTVELTLENVHPDASVSGRGVRELARTGLQRRLAVAVEAGDAVEIAVSFPARERYRFAAIGDAGGRGELRWCLQRAADLGADFLLHVGDIVYYEDDADAAAAALREAPIPVFAAIGNHDFHGGSRGRFRWFQEFVGPLNCVWELGGVTFLLFDTAADLVPAGAGRRGGLLKALVERPPTGPLIAVTHRPFADPRVLSGRRADPHALNRAAEADWLRSRLLDIGTTAMITGHIHASFDFDDRGLRTLIAGDGLGVRGDQATILIGDYSPGQSPEFHWEPLAMPESAWSPEYDQDRRRPEEYEKLH